MGKGVGYRLLKILVEHEHEYYQLESYLVHGLSAPESGITYIYIYIYIYI